MREFTTFSVCRATAQPRNMRNSFSRPQVFRSRSASPLNRCHNLSTVAGHRATILQPHSAVDGGQAMTAGVPLAVATRPNQPQPRAETRLRPAGQRPARRPEGNGDRSNRSHHAPCGCPRARPAATKTGRCRRLKPATPPVLAPASHGSLSLQRASVRFFQ